MKLKIISLILLSALVIGGCGARDAAGAAGSGEDETAAAETAAEAEVTTDPNDRSGYSDSLPDLDFEGQTINVYTVVSTRDTDFIGGRAELTGDLVDDAVIARNQAVCERLNIDFQFYRSDAKYNTVGQEVSKLVLSGDALYDYCVGQQFGLVAQAASGIYSNVLDLPYVDYGQPWWWTDYMDEISIGANTRFFLAGDYFIDLLRGTRVLYFNKELYRNVKGDPDEMYRDVFDQKWTMEKMAGLVAEFYSDLNGSGDADPDDQYGMASYATLASTDAFAFGADIHMTERGEDGMLTWTMGTERQIKAAELINRIFWNEGVFICSANEDVAFPVFTDGRALMYANGMISYMEDSLRSMENDFGMLPSPKLDETQDGYRALVHDTKPLGVVPVTCAHPELTGAVIEAMAAETWKSVTPLYYETALKVKYVRDDYSAQMIDIIHDSISTEFAFVYYASLNNAGQIYRTLVTAKSGDFMSTWAKMEKGAVSALEKLNSTYLENN